MQQSRDGIIVIPQTMRVTKVGETTYYYNADDLEPESRRFYKDVIKEHGEKPVVFLASYCDDEFNQIFKNAKRRGRFDKAYERLRK